jgi:hypothetical protein
LAQGRLRLGELGMGPVEGELIGRGIDAEEHLPLLDPSALLEFPPQ